MEEENVSKSNSGVNEITPAFAHSGLDKGGQH